MESSSSEYVYEPLEASRQIRLLKSCKSNDDEKSNVEIEIITVDFEQAPP